ncbi:MAG: cytochrome c [Proteobacteria bacterium]|nr:cytochrome c [Pseudomonadota bacterium]NDC25050.1 cytochrome c [Pseudomonadota bacterium]NDD05300.1 cytochrome c [Pseudomonadota bacterium]NDG27621.1 cytochrome c [Pseudomonadota bacterium]
MQLGKASFSIFFFSTLFFIPLLVRCGGVNSVYYDGGVCVDGITTASTGVQIYQTACASCHGAIGTVPVKGASASTISSKITIVPAMQRFACLTSAQIDSLAQANP